MAHIVRPLIQCLPRWRHRHAAISHLLNLHTSPRAAVTPPFLTLFSVSVRGVHCRSRARKMRDFRSTPPDVVKESEGEDDDVDGGEITKKSRNEKKREARRAVQWGMELATFSPPQIRRILRVADLQEEVFEALMVVKRLGRDVREGKRRQYSYIGGLLREVEPAVMETLIQATKDGDQSKFLELAGPEALVIDEVKEEEEVSEDEEEDTMNIALATRWFDGLVNKDISITNEIYSLREVEFDRQELRQLVRKVHSTLEPEDSLKENGKPAIAAVKARRSLTRFLRDLANQLPPE